MAKKRKRTKAERDAWNAHVDETIRMMRELGKRALDELQQKRPQAETG